MIQSKLFYISIYPLYTLAIEIIMRFSIAFCSAFLKPHRLVYSACGITRQGVLSTPSSNRELEAGKVMEVGEDSCFVTPPSGGYQVLGEFD